MGGGIAISMPGIMKGVLVILTSTHLLSASSDTYLVLDAMASSLFTFLPVLLAYTSAKKFGADPFTSVVIAGILLYPNLVAVQAAGKTLHYLGIPIWELSMHPASSPSSWLLVCWFILNDG